MKVDFSKEDLEPIENTGQFGRFFHVRFRRNKEHAM